MKTHASIRRAGSDRQAKTVRLRRAYVAALISLLAAVAASSTRASTWTEGLYVEVFGGLHGLADGDITQGGATAEGSYDGGQLFGAAVGKILDANWAVEAEFFYRSNDLDSVTTGGTSASVEGDFASTNLMFNGIYTFTRADGSGRWGKFSPYVGAGLGFLQEADIDFLVAGVEQEYDDSWIFAAQVFVGVSYALTERWSVFAETRYHYAGEIDLESSNGNPPIKADYDGMSGIVGVRHGF